MKTCDPLNKLGKESAKIWAESRVISTNIIRETVQAFEASSFPAFLAFQGFNIIGFPFLIVKLQLLYEVTQKKYDLFTSTD